jgi:hypothetical protein
MEKINLFTAILSFIAGSGFGVSIAWFYGIIHFKKWLDSGRSEPAEVLPKRSPFFTREKTKRKPIVNDDLAAWRKENQRE